MKKSLYFVALAALMASCANEESVQVGTPSNAIGFNTYVGKTTKAGDVTTANLESFWVYGGFADADLVFDGEEVSKSGADGWTYTGTQYWIPNKVYTFAAVAPQVNATYDLETLTIEGYEAGKDDLIVATTGTYTGQESDNDPVALNFKHALAKVQFDFKHGYEDVTNVKVKGVNSKGDLTATYGTSGVEFEWKNVGTPATSTYSGALYLIPQNVTETMILSFTQANTNYDVTLKIDAVSNWEAGKVYNYILDLSEGQERFEFEVTEPDWDSPSDNPLGEPQVNDGIARETKVLTPTLDGIVRDGDNADKALMFTGSSTDVDYGNLEFKRFTDSNNGGAKPATLVGLVQFTLNEIPENAEIEKAELRLVIIQIKGGDKTVNLYPVESFTSSSTWNTLGMENILQGQKITTFTATGYGSANIYRDNLSEEFKNISKWTPDPLIDLTDYVSGIIEKNSTEVSVAFCRDADNNESFKVGGRNMKDGTNENANFEIKAADIIPQLTISYKYPTAE